MKVRRLLGAWTLHAADIALACGVFAALLAQGDESVARRTLFLLPMSFRFHVTDVSTIAGVTTIGGLLEAGAISHNDEAFVRDQPELKVTIHTVAFVNPKPDRPSAARVLTIKPITFPASRLLGKILEKDDERSPKT